MLFKQDLILFMYDLFKLPNIFFQKGGFVRHELIPIRKFIRLLNKMNIISI